MSLKRHKGGFTLIELLVVISIIAMLASVVLASVSVARERGRIAAGVIFATHLFRAHGDQARLNWNFEDGTAGDLSGNNVNGTLTNGATIENTTYLGTGKSVLLQRSSQEYVNVSAGTTPPQDRVTIAAWIKASPDGSSNSMTIFGFHPTYQFHLDGAGTLSFNGVTGLSATTDLRDDRWHHVAVSSTFGQINGTGLYVDGRLVRQGTITLSPQPGEITVGAKDESNLAHNFNGYLDDVVVYPVSIIGQ